MLMNKLWIVKPYSCKERYKTWGKNTFQKPVCSNLGQDKIIELGRGKRNFPYLLVLLEKNRICRKISHITLD